MSKGMRRNDRPCWKCGQQVRHYRRVYRISNVRLPFNYWSRRAKPQVTLIESLVPIAHYIFKNRSYVKCKGSETPHNAKG